MKADRNGTVTHYDPGDFVTDHFRFREFCHRDAPWPVVHYGRLLQLATILEIVRLEVALGKTGIQITSGYRSPARNARTRGAATNSQHMHARAVDFRIWLPADLREQNRYTEEAHAFLMEHGGAFGVGALGWYPPRRGRTRARIHVDIRARDLKRPIITWTK